MEAESSVSLLDGSSNGAKSGDEGKIQNGISLPDVEFNQQLDLALLWIDSWDHNSVSCSINSPHFGIPKRKFHKCQGPVKKCQEL